MLPASTLLVALQGVVTPETAVAPDTVVTLMIPVRDLFDWTSGILGVALLIIVLAILVTMVRLLATVRASLVKTNKAVAELIAEARPVLTRASSVLDDTREVVALVRTDVERLSGAVGVAGEKITDIAEMTAARVTEVHAVLGVLQAELEHTAIGTVAAVKGVRAGVQHLAHELTGKDDPPDEYVDGDELDLDDTLDYEDGLDDEDDEFDEVDALDDELDELAVLDELEELAAMERRKTIADELSDDGAPAA